jgi:hypothetical protein
MFNADATSEVALESLKTAMAKDVELKKYVG